MGLPSPPLSDCPLLAGAGLLCIANALAKEASALWERGLSYFGFVFSPILQGRPPQAAPTDPGPPGPLRERALESDRWGFECQLGHFPGPIQVSVRELWRCCVSR